MQQDVHMLKMDIVWFQMFDYALQVFKDKMVEQKAWGDEMFQKTQDLQRQEPGVKVLAKQRFGDIQGLTEDAVESRAWI